MKLRKKEKKSNTALYMSIFIVVIMVASSFAIFLSNPDQASQITYGQYAFKVQTLPNDPHRYTLKLDDKTYGFYYLPTELTDVSINETVGAFLRNADYLIITFSPSNDSDEQVITDIVRFDFAQYVNKPFAQAVTEENTMYALPVLTCENATEKGPVIFLSQSDLPSGVAFENNCVIVQGKGLAQLRAGTQLFYAFLGVSP
ncbi:MAG: hypothetical protein V1725_03540 [archaeon]